MFCKHQNNVDLRFREYIRKIEFAIYTNTYAEGTKVNKHIRKETDLYGLPSDRKEPIHKPTLREDLIEAAKQGKYKLD